MQFIRSDPFKHKYTRQWAEEYEGSPVEVRRTLKDGWIEDHPDLSPDDFHAALEEM